LGGAARQRSAPPENNGPGPPNRVLFLGEGLTRPGMPGSAARPQKNADPALAGSARTRFQSRFGAPLGEGGPKTPRLFVAALVTCCCPNLILSYTRNRTHSPQHRGTPSCHAHSVRVPQARAGAGARCGERSRWLRPGIPWDGVSFLVVLDVFLLQSVYHALCPKRPEKNFQLFF
jgi:hypothetical protein